MYSGTAIGVESLNPLIFSWAAKNLSFPPSVCHMLSLMTMKVLVAAAVGTTVEPNSKMSGPLPDAADVSIFVVSSAAEA